ncbi:MAG: S41 family peptidase [Planctomycetota bacterium]
MANTFKRTLAARAGRLAIALASLSGQSAQAAGGEPHVPHAGMLRHPDVGPDQIVFRYADDIWRVDKEGGTAVRVAGPLGAETTPKFSPDGSAVAFVGNYDGNEDIYIIPTAGGQPVRMTYHSAGEGLTDWGHDGRLVYQSMSLSPSWRMPKLFTIDPDGGPPAALAIPYGDNGTISENGEWLAYTPHARDHNTWKRYKGGWASDIWLFHLKNNSSRRITDWEGTDSIPMWRGNSVYYLSDQGDDHRLNIWVYDLADESRRQVTAFTDFDVKWPSIGMGGHAGEIVFQLGPELRLLDLATEESRVVNVRIPGDRPTLRPRVVDASKKIMSSDISPTGMRAVFSARGDIWTVPAKHGSARNLTATPGVAERDPSWSPNGRWIAYLSDATGDYELYLTQSDGKGETRQLTNDGATFRHKPVWSPNSEQIAFADKTGKMFHHEIDVGTTTLIDTDPHGSLLTPNWAPDSRWIAYSKTSKSRNISSIWIYNVESGENVRVTSDMFNDFDPVFDREGEYLYFGSNRDFSSAVNSDLDTDFLFADTEVLLVCPLRDDVGSPWAPKSDEESWEIDDLEESESTENEGPSQDESDGEVGTAEDAHAKSVEIEFDGFERRALRLPIQRGWFNSLAVNDKGHLLYVRDPRTAATRSPAIKIYNIDGDEKEEKTVLSGSGAFSISADGTKLLVNKDGSYHIIDAAADANIDDTKGALSRMQATINPREEWAQVFHESWRIMRDYFYDPGMHGVDWAAIREAYEPMLADCVSVHDVRYVIGEMYGELNVGHAYVGWGFDTEPVPRRSVGMLGADIELNNGAFQIVNIVEGADWDDDARGPLSQPGIDVKEGDYLLEVNGEPLDVSKSPYAAFLGLGWQRPTVTLTVSDKPTKDDDARDVVVQPLGWETHLRFREWVERNREHVDRVSDGRVGYIYVPDTSGPGRTELYRQLIGQRHKEALIIDVRWNAGGSIPQRMLELLNRPTMHYWAKRDGEEEVWPRDAHHGPKCMLINSQSGSSGDLFPYYFRQAGLGPLIGTRTWGGVIGIGGYPRLIDGGNVTAPQSAFYEIDGTWGIEGHGVEPDIEVIDDPAEMVDGGDPQLDEAIRQMLIEIERKPFTQPERPAYPDRSGMGIPETDQ